MAISSTEASRSFSQAVPTRARDAHSVTGQTSIDVDIRMIQRDDERRRVDMAVDAGNGSVELQHDQAVQLAFRILAASSNGRASA